MHMKKHFLPILFTLFSSTLFAQTNVRAWYADGQVWIVWEASEPLPETFAVYAKPTAFTNTMNATLVGRLFKEEYGPAALREQVDSTATYHIPDGNGGIYPLAPNEALFVATPHQAGALFFAVVAWGQTTITPGVNITASATPFQYNPVGDPVECHLQKGFISPFDPDYVCQAYYMWADGRQNQWENRPDFPVMANAAKNGMPSFFMISAPMGLDTTGGIPLSVWLHGGGGTARQSLAGSRQDIHLNPKKGILLAHNDDLFGKLLTYYSGFQSASKHFGWRKNYDPFTGDAPTVPDTIVNYTQRRYFWIDEWLIRSFNVDRKRININGHSMGSKGTTLMAKAFPDHYASATILNNGFYEDDPPGLIDVAFGPPALNFPTNLKGYAGETIHFSNAADLETRISSARDLPLIRSFHSKNDTGNSNHWDAQVVEQYRVADSLGWGAQLNWSERAHGPDTGPDYNDHWINGNQATQQTIVDDIAYEEEHFRSDVSFPAFFNHRLDPQNNDPGDGTPGIGPNGVGDDWGTWGGYHRWENLVETEGNWQLTAWLESNAVFGNDNSPNNSLNAELAIRKPQQFKPATGKLLNWSVKDIATGNTLQSGQTTVQADDLVVIPQVKVFRENIRRVRISITDPSVPVNEPKAAFSALKIEPNPSLGQAVLSVFSPADMEIKITASCLDGKSFSINADLFEGANRLSLKEFDTLPRGFYFVAIVQGGFQQVLKWVKM